MFLPIIGTIFSGVTNYFNSRQEIKAKKDSVNLEMSKIELETKLDIARLQASHEVEKARTKSSQNYSLDRLAIESMKNSWKDEILLAVFMLPLIGAFVPSYAIAVQEGFLVIGKLPEWYLFLLCGMVITSYGMRSLLKMPSKF